MTASNDKSAPVVYSVGALVEGLQALGAKKIAVPTLHMKPLTQMVADYIKHKRFTVTDSLSMKIADSLKVGARNPLAASRLVGKLNTAGVDAAVLAACVQMPSPASIEIVEDRLVIPAISAPVCTAYACSSGSICRRRCWKRAPCCPAGTEPLWYAPALRRPNAL